MLQSSHVQSRLTWVFSARARRTASALLMLFLFAFAGVFSSVHALHHAHETGGGASHACLFCSLARGLAEASPSVVHVPAPPVHCFVGDAFLLEQVVPASDVLLAPSRAPPVSA